MMRYLFPLLLWPSLALAQVAQGGFVDPLSVNPAPQISGPNYTYTYNGVTGACTTNDPNGCTNNLSTDLVSDTTSAHDTNNANAFASFNTEAQRHLRPAETGCSGGSACSGNAYTNASRTNCAVLNIPAGTYRYATGAANGSLVATEYLSCAQIIGNGGSTYSTNITNTNGSGAGGSIYTQDEWQNNFDYFQVPVTAGNGQIGFFIQNAAKGATSVTLTTAANYTNFYVGRWVLIWGYLQQYSGTPCPQGEYPPNARYYDWAIVNSINSSTGVIGLDRPLTGGGGALTFPGYTGLNSGFSSTSVTWPYYGVLTDGNTGTCGPARITPIDTPAFPVQAYGLIQGVHFGTNPNWSIGNQVIADGMEIAGAIDFQVNDISVDNSVVSALVRNLRRTHSRWSYDEADKIIGNLDYYSDFVGTLANCATGGQTATFTGGGSANVTMASTGIPIGCPVIVTAATTLPTGMPILGGSGTTSSEIWAVSLNGLVNQFALSPYGAAITFSSAGVGTQTATVQAFKAGTYSHAGELYWHVHGGAISNQLNACCAAMTIGAAQALFESGTIINGMGVATFNGEPNQNYQWPTLNGLVLNGINFVGTGAGTNGPAIAAPFAQGSNANTQSGYITIDNGITISSGTYNSGTGAVSLTLSGTPAPYTGAAVGISVDVTNLTGTGGFASLNGNYITTSGSTGTTLNFTGATGLGASTITGGQVSFALACTGSGTPSCTNGPNGSGTRLQIAKFDPNTSNCSAASACGGVGTFNSIPQNVNDNFAVGMQQWKNGSFVSGCFVTNITSDQKHIFMDFTSTCTMTTGDHVWVAKTPSITITNNNLINIGGSPAVSTCGSGSFVAYNGSTQAASYPTFICTNNNGN